MEDYNGKYAIESICEGLLELSLDVSTWDPVARMAIGQACSFNTVFKALVNRRVVRTLKQFCSADDEVSWS